MVKKTVTYTDFNGNERTDELFFNLTDLEATELALELPDGVLEGKTGAFEALGYKGVLEMVKKVVLKAYGIKGGDDGRSFIKSDKIAEDFSNTKAFSTVVMELFKDNGVVFNEFLNTVMESAPELGATPAN